MKLTEIKGAQNDGLYRAENEIIYFRKYREGKGEIFRSCKTTSLDKARIKRDEFLTSLWGDKPLKSKRKTVGELWPIWFEGKKTTKRESSAKSAKVAYNNMAPYIENKFLDEVTSDWWLTEYIPKKRAETHPTRPKINMAKRKFFNEWKWLSMFLKWAQETGKGDPQWVRPKLINPDAPTDEGRVYSDEELASLRSFSTLRMATFLVAGAEHFMRRSEIRLLTWDRVDMDRGIIHLRAQDTKTDEERKFPFNEKLRSLLLEVKAENDAIGFQSIYVFPAMWEENEATLRKRRERGEDVSIRSDRPMTPEEFRHMWNTCCKKAGLPKGSRFHWLRHTGLTKAFKSPNANAALICHFAGLSLKEAQDTYLHFTPDDLRGVENLVGAS